MPTENFSLQRRQGDGAGDDGSLHQDHGNLPAHPHQVPLRVQPEGLRQGHQGNTAGARQQDGNLRQVHQALGARSVQVGGTVCVKKFTDHLFVCCFLESLWFY